MVPSAASVSLPFLTAYDPPGASEGTLDPMGLYQIADQLAVELVPAVRERMLRIRFLTAIAVGALVTEGLTVDPSQPESAPFLGWEWLVVESLIRSRTDGGELWGVPGTQVGRRAIDDHGYLDARSYLKTPRIFGFHGVYKRLAIRLGIVDVHLGPGPQVEALADAWARGRGFGGLREARPLLDKWTAVLRRGLAERPPRAKPAWSLADWADLAESFSPKGVKGREKQFLRELLHSGDERRLGALPVIWGLQKEFEDDDYDERRLHDLVEAKAPELGALLAAIRAYEAFARTLQDGFDLLRAEAARPDAAGYAIPEIGKDAEFRHAIDGLSSRFETAHRALGEVGFGRLAPQGLLAVQFGEFAEPMDAARVASAICSHHEAVQRAKSADGKRPWFDRLAADRIFVRHGYRIERPETKIGQYVHGYRGWPIRRFHGDLS